MENLTPSSRSGLVAYSSGLILMGSMISHNGPHIIIPTDKMKLKRENMPHQFVPNIETNVFISFPYALNDNLIQPSWCSVFIYKNMGCLERLWAGARTISFWW